MGALTELCKLERLSLTGSLVQVVLPALPALRELQVLDKVQPVFRGRCDQLEVLVVESFQTGCLPLRLFSRLTTMGVRKASLSAAMFDNASQERRVHIVNLDLTYSKLSGGVHSFFRQFPNLSSLNISFCDFSEGELIVIVGSLPQLTALSITGWTCHTCTYVYNKHVHVLVHAHVHCSSCCSVLNAHSRQNSKIGRAHV